MKNIRPASVDDLMRDARNSRKVVINGQPYVARPRWNGNEDVIPYYSLSNMRKRIYHAWLVLTGNALAVRYSEDFYKKEDIKTMTFE